MKLKQSSRLAACLALFFTIPSTVFGQEYHETVLGNGLRVVTIARPEVPMVALTTIVGAGSALEEESFSGASHFLEHLLFNGTSTWSQEELYAAVDRIGGYNNASTSDDHTFYVLLAPSEHLRAALEIQSGMLFDSTIPVASFDKERKIVLEEIAKDRSRPDHEVDASLRANLWPGTPWARPVIGSYDSLAGIERDRVWQYYKRQYVPGNMVLLVIGNFDQGEATEWVRELYGTAPGGDVPEVSDPWQGGGSGSVTQVAVLGGTPSLAIALPAPGICSEGGPEAALLAELLAAESGPLRSTFGIRMERIDARLVNRPRGSALEIYLTPAGGEDLDKVVVETLRTLESVALDPPSAPGFDSTAVLRVARAGRNSALLMGQRLHYLGMMLADSVAACDGSPERTLTERALVEPSGVTAIADRVLADASSRARVVVVADRSAAPRPLPPVEVSTASAELLPPAIPGSDLDQTLANGLRLLAVQETGSPVTGLHLLVRGRSAREPEGREGIADVLHRMLTNGTAISDRARLEARLQRIGAELKTADSDFLPYDDYYTSPGHSFVRLEAPSEHWLTALDLLAELVRTATLPEEALAPMMEARIRRAEKVAGSPSEVGRRAYRVAMLGNSDPYAHSVGGRPQTLQNLQRDELVAFAREYFDPAAFILTVVSPEEVEDVLGAVEERFGSAATHGVEIPTPEWSTTGSPGPPVRQSLGADQARLYLGRIAPLPAQERPALSLLAAVLSDRLLMTLREQEGLAYRLGATAEFAADPDQGWMTVSIGTRSENLDAALEGARREMARLAAESADDEELDRIRSAVRSRALMRRMPAVNRARYLGLRAFRQVPSTEDPDFLEAMDRVSRHDLEKLAGTWLDPSRFRVVIVD